MKPANFGSIVAKLIASGMLFAALSRHSHDYYTLLRWAVCGVAAFTVFQAVKAKRTGWLIIFLIIALLHNPIVPIQLKRDSWVLPDIASGAFFLLAIVVLDVRKARP